ncbi:MAG: hypothetical protein HYU64_17315, partial [Armatimonadetes bacterium]|nr:hypothetical protein [Armatimonadota bacterium]
MVEFNKTSSVPGPAVQPILGMANPKSPIIVEDAAAPPLGDFLDLSGRRKVTDVILDREPTKALGQPTKSFADGYGRVKHLALQLSGYAGGSTRREMLNAYKTLFTRMEPDTKFTIVVEGDRDRRDVEKAIQEADVQNPERIEFLQPNNLDLTVWARDQMISLFLPNDPDHTGLTNQHMLHNWHGDDMQVPPLIAEKYPTIMLDTNPRIVSDGGDEVSSPRQTFLGFYSLAATAKELQESGQRDARLKDRVVKFYEEATGKNVRLSGSDNPFRFKVVPRENPEKLHRFPYEVIPDDAYRAPSLGPNDRSEEQMWLDLAYNVFTEEYGKKITVMGLDDPSTPQHEKPASDHLDMSLTPIDEKTALVGDPSLIKRAFQEMSPEELRQAEARLSEISGRPVNLDVLLSETPALTKTQGNIQHDFDMYAQT